ncbi:Hypothetical predicted protein [Lecanosticta acicola]|uniref:Uncharacterized protein n=1 Tax=Lecanosticta acicola TaxID=111012 RepID=A0AAI8YZM0_9PEZI|nr:Hypothetical predicted protein [Lecanosticta acicola]
MFAPDPKHIDEKVLDHTGHIITHHDIPQAHVISRLRTQNRSLGSLSLIATHTRTQFAFYKNDPACLLTFRFQFLGSSNAFRFQKADVRIEFKAASSSHAAAAAAAAAAAPVVVDYGPKHLSSAGTDGQRNWWYNATLSASANGMVPVPVGPSISMGGGGSHGKHTAVTVEGADFAAHGQQEANIAKFWLREDEQRQDGVPCDFECAVIVKWTDSFEAQIDVKVGPLFDWLASPWPSSSPIIIQRGVDYGEPIRATPAVDMDFSTLTLEEWRKLVTPQLDFTQTLHRESLH